MLSIAPISPIKTPASARPAAASTKPADGTGDYDTVRRAIEFISKQYQAQPSLAEIADALAMPEEALSAVFKRWSGLTPKAFLQAVTIDHARRLLGEGASLLDAAYEVGLSGPSRLHDLFVKHEAVSPGAYKAKGEGITLDYGFHDTAFGRTLVVATDRGLAGIGFADAGEGQGGGGREGGEAVALDDMRRRWPKAVFRPDPAATGGLAERAFEPAKWKKDRPLKVVMIGTDFEIRVWEALLDIPVGEATTYSNVAARIGAPKAARAVGAAVGRNPISFVVPCHRVVGKSGALTGYHWGLTRKRAMLGWEAGILGAGVMAKAKAGAVTGIVAGRGGEGGRRSARLEAHMPGRTENRQGTEGPARPVSLGASPVMLSAQSRDARTPPLATERRCSRWPNTPDAMLAACRTRGDCRGDQALRPLQHEDQEHDAALLAR